MEAVLSMLTVVMVVTVVAGVVAIAVTIAQKGKSPSKSPSARSTSAPQPSSTTQYAYQFRGPLLSAAEMRFYRHLCEAVGGEFLIFSKVRVADVLSPESGLNRSDWQRAFNGISAKHFDFVLCNPNSAAVEFAIELDDKSHRQQKRVDRDRLLNSAAHTANLRLVRFPVQRSYSPEKIKAQLLSA
ncbi:MAG: DUF2726 domain-containing protein [Cyanobacteria bacterium P01_F01_bin.153]